MAKQKNNTIYYVIGGIIAYLLFKNKDTIKNMLTGAAGANSAAGAAAVQAIQNKLIETDFKPVETDFKTMYENEIKSCK